MANITYDDGAHLLRRMGFGGAPEQIEDLVSRGRESAVDYLVNYELIDNPIEDILETAFPVIPPPHFSGRSGNLGSLWWQARMRITRRQFEEKMTLFWHNHFATALSKVSNPLMYLQNLTLRKYALARFDDLLLKVAQDPAMLVWLDGVTNVGGRPNENFARELQELFTMGIRDVVTGEANYGESDVKEIARAFTGWKFKGGEDPQPNKLKKVKFLFNADEHDNGSKTIYGRTANYGGEDVVTIICARRATARFLIKKFFEFFVYPLTESDEDKTTIEKFADVYVNADHSIKAVVRAIFTSDEFFSERARFALVKTPPDFIFGSLRMLGVNLTGDAQELRKNGAFTSISARLGSMGLAPFNPPSVAGWDLNLAWISSATLLERYNFASGLTSKLHPIFRLPNGAVIEYSGPTTTIDLYKKYTRATAEETVRSFLRVLGPLDVDAETFAALETYLETDDNGSPTQFVTDDPTIDNRVRGLVHLIMCLPVFQLN